MKQSELLGKLMPGHPDLLPIIENIREKYQLPEVIRIYDIMTEIIRHMIISAIHLKGAAI